MSRGRALLLGTLAVGILDGLDAIVFFGLRGGDPVRIFQAFASGLIGPDRAFAGGAATILLGVLMHFTVALMIVLTYHLASRVLPVLTRRAVVCGMLYGVVAFLGMQLVVLPLSAVRGGGGLPAGAPLINGLLIHIFGVGLPAALSARAAAPRGAPPAG
jgi:hypothetical protein